VPGGAVTPWGIFQASGVFGNTFLNAPGQAVFDLMGLCAG